MYEGNSDYKVSECSRWIRRSPVTKRRGVSLSVIHECPVGDGGGNDPTRIAPNWTGTEIAGTHHAK